MIVMFSNSSRTYSEYVNLTHGRYVILVWIMPRILYQLVLSVSIVFVKRGQCNHPAYVAWIRMLFVHLGIYKM